MARYDHGDELEGVAESAPVFPVDAVVETAGGDVGAADVVVAVEQGVGTVVVPPAGSHVDGALVLVGVVVGLKQHRTWHQPEPGGERRAKGKLSTISTERTRKVIVSQTRTATISKATLGKRQRDGVERTWAFQKEEIQPGTDLKQQILVSHEEHLLSRLALKIKCENLQTLEAGQGHPYWYEWAKIKPVL